MTHPNNPQLKSFIEVSKDHPFPIQNLPFGVFQVKGQDQVRIGVAIGDEILDLSYLEQQKLVQLEKPVFQATHLNPFMELGKAQWQAARQRISELLRHDNPELRDHPKHRQQAFYKQAQVSMQMPVEIGDYTDFYSSKEHASNVGTMFRDKNNPLLPNWVHLPVGYHGRASSVVVSGTNIVRPCGQLMPPDADKPVLGPSRRLDFELEMAFFVGQKTELGQPLVLDKAEDHIFGLVLMNDWSARDIQKWEYVPLGPFVSKSFATTISPWVVSLEALEPFKVEGPKQEPAPLAYLQPSSAHLMHYDIHLEVNLTPAEHNQAYTISRSNTKFLYWSMAQQLVHHTITGCNLRSGDLMASGTISGPSSDSLGCLLELSWGGQKPLNLPCDVQRSFLEDGDVVSLTGFAQGPGYRIGFGDATGTILPARL